MTQLQLIHDLIEYAIWFSFLASVIFAPFASLFWPWWQHAWGVNIVTLEVAIAFALFPPWLNIAFGLRNAQFYLFAWIQLISIVVVGVVVIWRLFLIWSGQRHRQPIDDTQPLP